MFRRFMMVFAVMTAIVGMANPVWSAAKAGDAVVATVDGVKIYQHDFDREMQSAQRYFASQNQSLPVAEIKKAVLDKLVNGEILYGASQKKGITVTDAAVETQYDNFRSGFPDSKAFKMALAKLSIDEEGIKLKIKQSLAVEQFVDKEFFEKTEVPEQEIKDYYENNISAFSVPEQVHASHILINVKEGADEATKTAARKKLERIRKKIIAGGDFATFAKKNSDCPSSAKGGDLGFFGRGQMVQPFETAAFSMMPGDVSEVVETQFGYHLIKLLEKKHSETTSYEESRPRIENYLRQYKSQQALNDYLKATREKVKIDITMPAD